MPSGFSMGLGLVLVLNLLRFSGELLNQKLGANYIHFGRFDKTKDLQ
jgi:hypothetical protein